MANKTTKPNLTEEDARFIAETTAEVEAARKRVATRRLQPFRYLHDCSGCFRLERSPGGTCTHWKAPPYHGAHPTRTFGR
jgi:hypothetical protein